MKNNQKGFSAIEGILILIIVGSLGFVGWYVYNSNKEATNTTNETVKSASKTVETKKTAGSSTLANGSVAFKIPASWTKDGVGCIKDSAAYGAQQYLDSAAFLPGEKLPTIYGSGTEFFHVNICVFSNSKGLTPKDWFEDASKGGIGEGTGFPQDETSDAKINGYTAYYRKTMPSYEEVNYVISGKNKIVLIKARTYETDDSLPGVGDFKKFEPAIKDLAGTVTIN